jgi:hypothetical protein
VLPIYLGKTLRTESDSDVKWLGDGQQCKNDRGWWTYIDLHQNQNPQQSLYRINSLHYYPTPKKIWFVEIFDESGGELRSIGGGPAGKNKSIQHDHIWYLKCSANTSVVAAMSGFADGAG